MVIGEGGFLSVICKDFLTFMAVYCYTASSGQVQFTVQL